MSEIITALIVAAVVFGLFYLPQWLEDRAEQRGATKETFKRFKEARDLWLAIDSSRYPDENNRAFRVKKYWEGQLFAERGKAYSDAKKQEYQRRLYEMEEHVDAATLTIEEERKNERHNENG